jgi:predicted RNA methylase
MELLIPHEVYHHSTMLNDRIRMNKFDQSLRDVLNEKDIVVDIGAGTGVLSAMATQYTQGKIYAVEYFKSSAEFARKHFSILKNNQVEVIHGASYDLVLTENPDVVVTETLGPVGPEENIVEICYQFQKRFPCVKRFIPFEVKMFALPVMSQIIENKFNQFKNSFEEVRYGSFNFELSKKELESSFCRQIFCEDLSKSCMSTYSPFELAFYQLGKTKTSSFVKDLCLSDLGKNDWNGIHIFFQAKLSDNVTLSSSFLEPFTHWKHSFVSRPHLSVSNLRIEYLAESRSWKFLWN